MDSKCDASRGVSLRGGVGAYFIGVRCSTMDSATQGRVLEVLRQAKVLAGEYYRLTGKPLGVTGEVAEYEAATKLDLELVPPRTPGYDAIERTALGPRRLQIKGRCLVEGSKKQQMLGALKPHAEWDAVLMVKLDGEMEAVDIWEAPRDAVLAALATPGSKARNERGALPMSKIRSIGRLRWSRDTGKVI